MLRQSGKTLNGASKQWELICWRKLVGIEPYLAFLYNAHDRFLMTRFRLNLLHNLLADPGGFTVSVELNGPCGCDHRSPQDTLHFVLLCPFNLLPRRCFLKDILKKAKFRQVRVALLFLQMAKDALTLFCIVNFLRLAVKLRETRGSWLTLWLEKIALGLMLWLLSHEPLARCAHWARVLGGCDQWSPSVIQLTMVRPLGWGFEEALSEFVGNDVGILTNHLTVWIIVSRGGNISEILFKCCTVYYDVIFMCTFMVFLNAE